MNLGVTLKQAEKKFGPALPGQGDPDHTLSAVRYAAGKAKKFAGLRGIHDGALFYVHFPTPVNWEFLASKKGVPDFVNDLRESGPQGGQGRAAEVERFLEQYEEQKAKLLAKQAAAEKKTRMARLKEEAARQRESLARHVGEREVTLVIGSESFSLPVKISLDAKGKVKIAATL